MKTALIVFLKVFLIWQRLEVLAMSTSLCIAIMHPFRSDVKALLDMTQDGNGCKFINELTGEWQRDPLGLGFDVV